MSQATKSSSTFRLFEEARTGDSDSLGLLLRKYFRYLNALSMRNIDDRIRLRVSPSDVVQETLLEAHRDFPKFAGTTLEEFTGWLRRILFNNLASAIENHVLAAKRDVRKQRSIDEKLNNDSHSTGMANLLPDDMTTVSSAMRRDESLDQMKLAISLLPDDHRRVIELRHFDGLGFQEIAKRMNRSEGATRMLWVRAVEKLRHVMPPER